LIDLKVFDDYTFYHSLNVAVLSLVLGVALKYNKEELYKLGLAALLHDIGKVFIPKDILNKKGKLTDEEFEIIKTHSDKGFEYLKNTYNVPITTYMGVRLHHEKYNGGGYPLGKKGEEIYVYARIIAIADVYDALTSDRVYRKAMTPSEAMEYIMGNSGIMFDPNLVELFIRKVAPYPVGTSVQLSDGRVGIVVENYENFCLRPKIKIIKEKDKNIEPYLIELRNKETMHITITGFYTDTDAF